MWQFACIVVVLRDYWLYGLVGLVVHMFLCSYFGWCMQNICSVESSFLGMLSSGGIVGSSYVMVSAAKWAIICVSGNRSECRVKFWYQFVSGEMSIVMVFGSFLEARWAQCIACCKSVALLGWVYAIPFHLWSKALPKDPNILSRENGE